MTYIFFDLESRRQFFLNEGLSIQKIKKKILQKNITKKILQKF